MKRKCLITCIVTIIGVCSSIFAGDLSSLLPTKEYLSLSYQQGFTIETSKETDTVISNGLFRFGTVAFWNNSHFGLGVNLNIGGPYNFNIENKQNGSVIDMPGKELDTSLCLGAKIAWAFDIPVSQSINLFGSVGPSYDIMIFQKDIVMLYDMVFGAGCTFGCIFAANKLVNFVVGIDLDYYFLQLGFSQIGNNTYEASAHTSVAEIRPYIGISFKTDKIFRSAVEK